MTGKTHQSISLLAVTAYFISSVKAEFAPATFGAILVGSYIGSLLPDIDQPAGKLWQDLPFGRTLGKLSDPFLEHRNITHSISGFVLVGIGAYYLLRSFPDYWGIDNLLVFICFMIAYASHLISDMFTEEGIPIFFPYHRTFGIPPRPFQKVRIKTGKWFENLVVLPATSLATLILVISYWEKIRIMLFK